MRFFSSDFQKIVKIVVFFFLFLIFVSMDHPSLMMAAPYFLAVFEIRIVP